MIMLVLSFFSWWYGRGWKQVLDSFEPRLRGFMDIFSVNQLLKTLFAPWRRIISYPGASLDERFRAWGDNLFSRMIGFVVRFFVLLTALLSLALITALTVVELIVWPLLPVAVPGCIVAGLLI
jgi:hypothetical protein